MELQTMLFKVSAFLCIFLSISCQGQDTTVVDTASLQLVTVKEFTINSEAAQHLGRVLHRISASPSADLLALSNSGSPAHIVIVDYDGNLVDLVGSEGRGPEELSGTRHFGFDHLSNMIIYDYALGVLKFFDRINNTVSSYLPPLAENTPIRTSGMINPPCNGKWFISTQTLAGSLEKNATTTAIFDNEFNFQGTLGTYDPFFLNQPRSVLQKPYISVDCEHNLLYTTHPKVPFFQVYNITDQSFVHRTETIPPSFNLSDSFISAVYDLAVYREFLRDEQSSNTKLFNNNEYILSGFFNNTTEYIETGNPAKRDYFIAVYSKEDYSLIDEFTIDSAIYGITRQGYLIEVTDDNPENFTIRFLEIQTASGSS